jgi:hypothetical protein
MQVFAHLTGLACGALHALRAVRPRGRTRPETYRSLTQKQVDLLTQAFPGKTRLAVLFDAQSADQFAAAEGIAKSLNLKVQPIKLENLPYDFETRPLMKNRPKIDK